MAVGFRGGFNQAVQTAYSDRPAPAFEGQLGAAPDLCLIQGFPVFGNRLDSNGDVNTDGAIPVGRAVFTEALDVNANDPGPRGEPFAVRLPDTGVAQNGFVGITLNNKGADTLSDGSVAWLPASMADVLRVGIVWIRAYADVRNFQNVFVVRNATNSANAPLGSFVASGLGGTAIQLNNAHFYGSASAGDLVRIEVRRS